MDNAYFPVIIPTSKDMKYFNHAIYNKQEFTIDASKKQEKENNKKSKANINNNIYQQQRN